MASILLSGPAGGAKSQVAIELIKNATGPTIAADFQSIVVALLQLQRGPDGRYPVRPEWILPLTEYVRQAAVEGAINRDISVILTNSDGSPSRRDYLLNKLGPGATEQILDPGEDVVKARLSSPKTGKLSRQCGKAIGRWYGRR